MPAQLQEKQRVLVVDDEQLISATLSLILQRNGFDTFAAYSGEQALEVLDTFRPDILITDVVMPDIDGREVARKAAERYPGCRIFLLTGHAHHIDFTDLQALGIAFEVIAKPAHPAELLRHLEADSQACSHLKPTALVVDDFEPHRYSVRRLLQQAGFEVIEAANGRECLQQAANAPDVIVLDIHLPDSNGFELCRKLRASAPTAKTPIVHLSATATSAEAKEESRLVGANDYMTSPFDPSQLLVKLCSLVQAHYLTQDPPTAQP
jgi:CheY-like chemotaxis protein